VAILPVVLINRRLGLRIKSFSARFYKHFIVVCDFIRVEISGGPMESVAVNFLRQNFNFLGPGFPSLVVNHSDGYA
jgi:hypothetical protein